VFAGAVGFDTYQPETLTAYEIGAKNRFLDNRLQINVDAFYYNYKNYQVDQLENLPVGNGTFAFGDDIFNAEKATEFGAELESRWAVTDADVVGLNLAWLHAKFDKFLFPIQADPSKPFITDVSFANLSGTQPTSAPELTGTFSYLHTAQLSGGSSLQMMLQTHVESAYWLAVDHNIDPVKEMGSRQRGYTRTQAVVTYITADQRFSVQAFVRNIENKAVMNTFSYGGDGPAYASVSPPRTYGIAVGAHF
jgi:iron complex outermembrane receptor protein